MQKYSSHWLVRPALALLICSSFIQLLSLSNFPWPTTIPSFPKHHQENKLSILLETEVEIQKQFQQLIHMNQNPDDCTKARILLRMARDRDGFTLELQEMGRMLQIAIATERTLVIDSSWRSAYEPPNCHWDIEEADSSEVRDSVNRTVETGWTCLYEPISACTSKQQQSAKEKSRNLPTGSSSYGIIGNESWYFDVRFYGGAHRVVEAPLYPWSGTSLIDVIPEWERAYGRFWIRAQMVHYLWRPQPGLQRQIESRVPSIILSGENPYIAFHIRYTDNVYHLKEHFGRDANVTRSFTNFMRHAEILRTKCDPSLRLVYVATDNSKVMKEARSPRWAERNWSFVVQRKPVQRWPSNTNIQESDYWFMPTRSTAAGGIAADVEALRRADYLVGSFQSNVYRLATELNTAYHVGRYPRHINRHRSVDVEWYEDP